MSTLQQEEIRIGPLGIRFLLEGSSTGGALAAFEFRVPPGARVPVAHSHDAYEETVYGLDGVMTWTVDGDVSEMEPGDILCIRRGSIHRFENHGAVEARCLAVVTPGILGPDYFSEVGAVVASAVGGPPDPAAIAAVMRRHGLTPAP